MRLVFLDCTDTSYNGDTMRRKPLGGIETVTVSLAEALAAAGHDVCVYNKAAHDEQGDFYGVSWQSYDALSENERASVVIANNDPALFDVYAKKTGAKRFYPVLWMHNRMLVEKTIRKGRFLPFLRWRPHGVFLGSKQYKSCSPLHPFRKKTIIPHGLTESFLGYGVVDSPPAPQAIFFSQAYRGLSTVVSCWVDYVFPQCPQATLKVFVGNIDLQRHGIAMSMDQLKAKNIVFMPRVPKRDLIENIRESRVMMCPGHKDETFCNAAAEANALGVPVVTNGIGALSERIVDGQNGYIVPCGNGRLMGEKSLSLLTDNAVWKEMSQNAIRHTSAMVWDGVAGEWNDKVFKHAFI